MTPRARTPATLALAAALLLAAAGAAPADQAYDKVASAYAQAGGQLDPCAFTQAELEAAVRGIPPQIRDVVPDLRAAMVEAIAAHQRGDCRGRGAEEGTTGGAGVPPAGATPTTTPPVTTPPATAPVPAPADTTTAPAPAATAPGSPTTAAQPADDGRDLAPLLIALVAAGTLLLLALLLWALTRMRGWDPTWVARVRHAWGEAGFRTTSTWTEFTDWLRLGR